MKNIKGFNKYYATTCGSILSKKTKRKIKPYLDNAGYKCVNLKDDDGFLKHIRVHRLVAATFINFDRSVKEIQVNHIDANKLNCCILNLEKATNKENTEHGYDCNLYTTRNRVEIEVINKETKHSFYCKSFRECEALTGINRKLISSYIKGIKKNVSGFNFKIAKFDRPFRIIDELGNDFRSVRQCSIEYGFSTRIFSALIKKAPEIFSYKGIVFKKYFV
ncbi:MAG: hypothetical protein ACRC5T_13225 [Cetobacterium sp.]